MSLFRICININMININMIKPYYNANESARN